MGELRALPIERVLYAERLIQVEWNHVRGETKDPKSHRVRAVPMTDDVARALDHLTRREHFTGPEDLVFGNEVGGPLDDNEIRRRFKRAVKRAGLREPWPTFHELRHTFGTLAVQRFTLPEV